MSNIIERVSKHASENTIYHALYGFYFRGMSIKDLAETYHKNYTTISRWIKAYEEKGEVIRRKSVQATYRKFDEHQRSWLVDLYKVRPILHQNEAALLFFQTFQIQISTSSISTILSEAGLTWKVLERRAIQIQLVDILRFCNEISSFLWVLECQVKSMMRKRGTL